MARCLLLLLLLVVNPVAKAEAGRSIFGVWATPKYHGHVLVEPCGASVCAQVLDGDPLRANPAQMDIFNHDPAKRGRRVKGLYVLQGYHGGPRRWTGGTVYDPQTGDESNDSTLDLLPEGTLRVKGCRFMVCRSEIWRRDPGKTSPTSIPTPSKRLAGLGHHCLESPLFA